MIKVWSGAQRGGRRAQFPGAESLRERWKAPTMSPVPFFNTEHLLPKDLRFEHEGAKLASCPGRHLASLRPWVWWALQQIISLTYPVASHW